MGDFVEPSTVVWMVCVIDNSGVDAVLQTSSIVGDFCFGIGKPPTLERFPKVLNILVCLIHWDPVIRGSVRDGKVTVGSGCVRTVHPNAKRLREELQATSKETCMQVRKREKHVDAERESQRSQECSSGVH